MTWQPCIVESCTFEGTHAVPATFGGGTFYYCAGHLAKLGLDEPPSLPPDGA